ncbi:MAG: hypothetical protein GY870_06950, partial [archaeon]|nr:hypothetical protein [archaeon]
MNAKKRLLLFRGDEELAFLKEWIEKRPEAINKNEDTAGNSSTREVIENCGRCSNIYNKKFGYGNGDNGILILLNMPKAFSDSERNSLKSESINLLKKMMQAIDIDFEQCYTTNLIKCESRDVLNRPSLMFQNCENIFRRELKEKIPKIVIIMGSDTP